VEETCTCGWRCDNPPGCAREKACRRKCAVRSLGVEEKAFRARWGCAQGTRAQEERIGVEERTFRTCWGARRARGEVDA